MHQKWSHTSSTKIPRSSGTFSGELLASFCWAICALRSAQFTDLRAVSKENMATGRAVDWMSYVTNVDEILRC